MPKITVVLPVYNSIKYITETLDSIQAQTFTDWECIVVNEYGSEDGSADVVKKYARKDSRFQLIQNRKRLGLAESLNIGIKQAKGTYIARVDADDPSYPERFEIQFQYMEEYPDTDLCGTKQRSVLPAKSYVEEVPCDPEELKAALLFGCELSHCSVMFRRETFVKNGWLYDKRYLGEDYELWTRIMFQAKLVNLNQVLVNHRWGFENISIEKGGRLHDEVRKLSARALQNFGITVAKEDLWLLSGWRNRPEEYATYHRPEFLRKTYRLLEEIQRRNQHKPLVEPAALHKILYKRWNWACKCCGLFFSELPCEIFDEEGKEPPVVSILLPVYQAADTLRETIDSILRQEWRQWELLVLCEAGCRDGSLEIAGYYAKVDKRIRVIENQRHLGLAESLNEGIRAARGEFLARIDADDLANAKRIGTQVSYLRGHPKVGAVQCYQHYFGQNAGDFIHCPPVSAKALKAKLLFFCDACHSTVMLRKSVVEQYGLFYKKDSALEDYELWARLIRVTDFETIPLVYGEYRIGRNNISRAKEQAIQEEMCRIIAGQLSENLGIILPKQDWYLMNGWCNPFQTMVPGEREKALTRLQSLLLLIWRENLKRRYYDKKELLKAIAAKWRFSKYDESWHGEKKADSIYRILELKGYQSGWRRLCKKPLTLLQRFRLHVDGKSIEHCSNVLRGLSAEQQRILEKSMEQWTWERYQRTERMLLDLKKQNEQIAAELAALRYKQNLIPYIDGEKVRIVFLFQAASFWPSWESVYEACMADSRVEVKLVFLDETETEQSQMKTAREFLQKKGCPFTEYENFDMEDFFPHILMLQTPYDAWHRHNAHWANIFKGRGYRIVYIPYGIEISDTQDSHNLHFNTNVVNNCWRIYTFSEAMRRDYWKYASNRRAVRVTGLPKFDFYFDYIRHDIPDVLSQKTCGKKIVLWKVHFPKSIWENGRRILVTPDLEEYINFALRLEAYEDFFFIFMPHPKFREKGGEWELVQKALRLYRVVSGCHNTYIDESDDYRISLRSADAIIVDRSAVMVEAGAMGVPVLYMTNADYYEPLTAAIKPLIDSYYQGSSAKDIEEFLEMCAKDQDERSLVRKEAFIQCIPVFDGKAGVRIRDDMIEGVVYDKD